MKHVGYYVLACFIGTFMLSEINLILAKGLIAIIVGILIAAMASVDKSNGDQNNSK